MGDIGQGAQRNPPQVGRTAGGHCRGGRGCLRSCRVAGAGVWRWYRRRGGGGSPYPDRRLGSGLLTETVIRAWDRLQARGRSGIDEADLRDALAAELESSLASDTPAAAALRKEVAGVLRGVQAVQVAVTAAVEESAAGLREVLVRGLCELGEEFSEFGWVLDDVNQQLAVIAAKVNQAAANSREMADDQQQTLVELQMLRKALGARAGWCLTSPFRLVPRKMRSRLPRLTLPGSRPVPTVLSGAGGISAERRRTVLWP